MATFNFQSKRITFETKIQKTYRPPHKRRIWRLRKLAVRRLLQKRRLLRRKKREQMFKRPKQNIVIQESPRRDRTGTSKKKPDFKSGASTKIPHVDTKISKISSKIKGIA